MNPLWITLYMSQSGSWIYRLQTHFEQPIRTGTKRECNYEWHSNASTFNEYKRLSAVPTAISDLVREACASYGESYATLYQQFAAGEIALKISEQGVTVYKPYNKSKSKVQDPSNELISDKVKQRLVSEFESVLYNEMPMIEGTLPVASDVFMSDVKSLI